MRQLPEQAYLEGAMAERQGEFGRQLRELRTRARLTQEELADAARVSERAVHGLERGVTVT